MTCILFKKFAEFVLHFLEIHKFKYVYRVWQKLGLCVNCNLVNLQKAHSKLWQCVINISEAISKLFNPSSLESKWFEWSSQIVHIWKFAEYNIYLNVYYRKFEHFYSRLRHSQLIAHKCSYWYKCERIHHSKTSVDHIKLARPSQNFQFKFGYADTQRSTTWNKDLNNRYCCTIEISKFDHLLVYASYSKSAVFFRGVRSFSRPSAYAFAVFQKSNANNEAI